MSNVAIKVNGNIFDRWTYLELTKSIEMISGQFVIRNARGKPLPIVSGDQVEVLLYGQTVIKGWVDKSSYTLTETNSDVSITGRDFSADLIDCSAVTTTNAFYNITFKSLAEKLLKPFGIPLKIESTRANKIIPKVSLQQDSVFQTLERESRKVGVLIYSDYSGSLVIADIGTRVVNTRLMMPGNMISVNDTKDLSQRFSKYIVKARQSSSNSLSYEQQTQVVATAEDRNVKRYRPLIIIGESNMNWSQAKDRVQWEAAVRAGRTDELSCRVDSWVDSSNKLWEINTLVSVFVNDLNINKQFVIKTVKFNYDSQEGIVADLTLVDKDVLKPEPIVPKKEKST